MIEATARILPQYDAELTRPVGYRLQKLGITVRPRRQSTGYYAHGTGLP